MEEEIEIFKDIPGYEELYQVSSFGRVWSMPRIGSGGHNGKFLKQTIGSTGYYNIALCLNGKPKTHKVHQLVAITFLNHKPNGTRDICVDHKDNNRFNNRLSNLQLVSHRKNMSKDRKGSSKYTGVRWVENRNKWRASISINGKQTNLGSFTLEEDAAAAYQKALLLI